MANGPLTPLVASLREVPLWCGSGTARFDINCDGSPAEVYDGFLTETTNRLHLTDDATAGRRCPCRRTADPEVRLTGDTPDMGEARGMRTQRAPPMSAGRLHRPEPPRLHTRHERRPRVRTQYQRGPRGILGIADRNGSALITQRRGLDTVVPSTAVRGGDPLGSKGLSIGDVLGHVSSFTAFLIKDTDSRGEDAIAVSRSKVHR